MKTPKDKHMKFKDRLRVCKSTAKNLNLPFSSTPKAKRKDSEISESQTVDKVRGNTPDFSYINLP
ncbi:MAG: hypothetical protein IJ054_07830 [Lachnospiraceae bacterium]|nr:hypothetical protein [Lachnospiraceae bacterium]